MVTTAGAAVTGAAKRAKKPTCPPQVRLATPTLMAAERPPAGIDRKRHAELIGRSHHVWMRRVGIMAVVTVPILAAWNAFGQHASVVSVGSDRARLEVDSPSHLRGGLLFTTEMVITAVAPIRDARIRLASGWFQGMTYNAIAPQPSAQTAVAGWEIFDFGRLSPGQRLPMWISWQVNPTNVGRHSQDVELYDGSTRLLLLRRAVTVFP